MRMEQGGVCAALSPGTGTQQYSTDDASYLEHSAARMEVTA